MSISFAESCTGGWVGKEFTAVPGSSKWYGFGFITYSNKAKLKVLEVSKDSLLKEGAVSETVVKEMAEGALNKSGSDFAISISGIAGPSGGTEEKPVGTVCFGIGSINSINCHTKYFEGERNNLLREESKSSNMNGTNRQIIAITVMVRPCLIRTCRNLEI